MNPDETTDRSGSDDPLEQATRALRSLDTPPLPDAVACATRAAADRERLAPRSLAWHLHALRAAVAAGVAVLIGSGVFMALRPAPALAFAAVVENVERAGSFRAKLVIPATGLERRITARGPKLRLESDEFVQITDTVTGQTLVLDTRRKIANDQTRERFPADPVDFFRKLGDGATRPIDGRTIDGVKAVGFEGAIEVSPGRPMPVRVWADPSTKLPLRVEIFADAGGATGPATVLEAMRFDEPVDDALFSFDPPPGYAVARGGLIPAARAATMHDATSQPAGVQDLLDAIARVEATRTLTAGIRSREMNGVLAISGRRMRFDGREATLVTDFATGRSLQLVHQSRQAFDTSTPAGSRLDLYRVLRDLPKSAVVPTDDFVEEMPAPGLRALRGFAGDVPIMPGAKVTVPAKAWLDPDTGMPARVELSFPGEQKPVVFERIAFDVEVPESHFSLDVPEGYTLIGARRGAVPAAPKELVEKVALVKPGAGLGDAIQLGMTREQIFAAIGKPDVDRFDTYLTYLSFGFELQLDPGARPQTLQRIVIGPADAASRQTRRFEGGTDKGIGLGSTAEQVIAAYGEPDAPTSQEAEFMRKHPDSRTLRYARIGLELDLLNGKTVQVSLTKPQ